VKFLTPNLHTMKCVLFAFVAQATANSFESCNKDDAHFKNMAITVSPDPPKLGQMTTVVIEGDIDKSITAGKITSSLTAGVIKVPESTTPFSWNQQGPVSHVKLTLGPFKYPNIRVPLIKTIKAAVEVHDQDGEQVFCVKSTLPALSSEEPDVMDLQTVPFTSCNDETTSHVHNFHMETDPKEPKKGDMMTTTLGLDTDEDISSGHVAINVDLSLFKLNMDVPFAIEPALPTTNGVEVSVGPSKLENIPLIPNAKGSVHLFEQNGEPCGCVNFNVPVYGDVAV